MSGLITNGRFWTTDCIRHPKRRLCCCCPNGLHIDVDFDIFYQTLIKMQRNESPTKQYKHFKRKQETTLDELLGSRVQTTTSLEEFIIKRKDMPAKASPDVQESLEQALHDFEETLIRSSTSDSRSPLMSPLLTDNFSSSLSLRSDSKSTTTDNFSRIINNDDNFEQHLHDKVASPLHEFTRELYKDIGINCSITTRDIGTTYTIPICNTVGTSTHIFMKDVSTSMPIFQNNMGTNTTVLQTKDSETMTNEEMNKNKSQFSLNQILNYYDLNKLTTVGTQTMSRITTLQIIEKNDVNTQTDELKLSQSFHECNFKDILQNRKLKNRTISTSTQDLPLYLNFKCDKITYSKYSQTKSVIIKEEVFYRKCGTQTDNTRLRYREMGVNTERNKLIDVSVGVPDNSELKLSKLQKSEIILSSNIFKKPIICENERIANGLYKDTIQISKIPRLKNTLLNLNNRKQLLMRQDTYVKLPATEPEQLRKEQEYSATLSESDLSAVNYPKKSTVTALFIPSTVQNDESFFQPISENRIKGEPSKEMKAAMKVLNDSLKKSSFSKLKETVLKSAVSVIQQEWFNTSSLSNADPGIVEDYLDAFEEISTNLIEFIVNIRDGAGNSAMHYAVSHGNFDVVSILLDSKVCDINIINDAGYTCVMLVSLANIKSSTHYDVIKRLFKLADVNTRAKEHGQTTLMLAASHGKLDIVNLLLESDADVNIQDNDGSTALMCAAEHGYLDIVNVLVSHPDCDLTIKDNDGSTALTIAMEAGHREIGVALYTRQHFSDLSYFSSREKRSRSANPILIEHRIRTPLSKSSLSSPSAVV